MAVINDMGNTFIINIFPFFTFVIFNVIVFGTSANRSDIGIFFIGGFRTRNEKQICLIVVHFIGSDTLFNDTISVSQTVFVVDRQGIKAIMQLRFGNCEYVGIACIHPRECLDTCFFIDFDGRNNDITQINTFPFKV